MSRILTLLVLLSLLVPLGLAADNPASQDEDATVPGQQPGDQDGQADDSVGTDQAQAEEEEGDVRFIPTEEISQDLGVSFPVDI